MINNSDNLSIHQKTDITGLCPVPFSENNIVNLVSMTVLINKNFRVFFHSTIKTLFFCSLTITELEKFEKSDNGLYFYNKKNC